MQRKFLEDLGLEKEIVDKIMSENGSDIEKTKARLEAERDNYKEQLETAQNALKEFVASHSIRSFTTSERSILGIKKAP